MKSIFSRKFCCSTFLLIICISIGVILVSFWRINQDLDTVIKNISDRNNINPTGDSVRNYVYCSVLVIGDPIVQVEKKLKTVDDYTVFGNYQVKKYRFVNPDVNYLLGELHLTFNSDWKLVEKGKAAGFGDYSKINCLP